MIGFTLHKKYMSLVNIIQEHIVLQPSSGLTIKDYCHQHSINPSTFYYWRKKLSEEKLPTSKGFKELPMHTVSSTNVLTISFPNGVECKFGIIPDILFMKRLLDATS
jgi:hypothetical protein